MDAEIRAVLPNIDPVVSEYSVGYLTHASTSWSDDDQTAPIAEAASTVTELLLSASGSTSTSLEEQIRKLVEKWVDKYIAANAEDRKLNFDFVKLVKSKTGTIVYQRRGQKEVRVLVGKEGTILEIR